MTPYLILIGEPPSGADLVGPTSVRLDGRRAAKIRRDLLLDDHAVIQMFDWGAFRSIAVNEDREAHFERVRRAA